MTAEKIIESLKFTATEADEQKDLKTILTAAAELLVLPIIRPLYASNQDPGKL